MEGIVDGDEMNIHINIDRVEEINFDRLSPNCRVMDPSQPFKVSSALKLPTPPIATVVNMLEASDAIAFAKD